MLPARATVVWNFFVAFGGLIFLPSAHSLAINYPLIWRWSNPQPHGNNIIDMGYADGLTVQIGERGQIHTSEDLNLWIPRDSHTNTSLRALTFLGGRLVITGESGTVLYADVIDDFRASNLGTTDWL